MDASTSTAPVVVGVDGSDEALVAVEWAAGYAYRLRRPLQIVHAFEWPMFHVKLGPPAGAPPWTGLANAAQRIVDDALARARETAPQVAVEGEYVEGFRRPVLFARTAHAHAMVVGSRGLGGVGALLIGSTGVELAAHAKCPTVVVPRGSTAPPTKGMVAAVDCSPSSGRALEFALEEAATLGVELGVVLAWEGQGLRAALSSKEGPADQEPTEEAARSRLTEFATAYRERHPEVRVEERVVRGGARGVLIEQTASTELLVVGSRGYGGLRGLLLGSVGQAVLHHARCPVAVVPPAE